MKPRLDAAAVPGRDEPPRSSGRLRGDERTPLEGFLFPATYDFFRTTTVDAARRRQLDAFQRDWSQVDLRYARSKNLTPYDVLIIASMIEEEAAAPRSASSSRR